jgi:hypothetical protein
MAALSVEVEQLGKDAAAVRNLLTAEELARGKPYTAGERANRVRASEAQSFWPSFIRLIP